MSDWYDTFNDVFWLSISTGVLGFFAVTLKYCLRSKCDDVSFCGGLLHIHRRVELENSDDEEKSDESKNNRK